MTVSDQYKIDHRCETCMAWDGVFTCRRLPKPVIVSPNDWCCEHIPDERHQKEPVDLSEIGDHVEFWYEHG